MKTKCPHCHKIHVIADSYEGRCVTCPKCNKDFDAQSRPNAKKESKLLWIVVASLFAATMIAVEGWDYYSEYQKEKQERIKSKFGLNFFKLKDAFGVNLDSSFQPQGKIISESKSGVCIYEIPSDIKDARLQVAVEKESNAVFDVVLLKKCDSEKAARIFILELAEKFCVNYNLKLDDTSSSQIVLIDPSDIEHSERKIICSYRGTEAVICFTARDRPSSVPASYLLSIH